MNLYLFIPVLSTGLGNSVHVEYLFVRRGIFSVPAGVLNLGDK